LLVDVLHHADDGIALLKEASRVTKSTILLKDHVCDSWLATPTLRLMDWFGNAYAGVALPYCYWNQEQWNSNLRSAGLKPVSWRNDLGLYPWPLSALFDRKLHVFAAVEIVNSQLPSQPTGPPASN
jgi:hypothetical protein